MADTILNTIKKLLGYNLDDDYFDDNFLVNINASVISLEQLGGIDKHIIVTKETTWTELLDDDQRYDQVKMYIYLKTKISIDPPLSSYALESLNHQLDEMAFLLKISRETR